MESDSFRRPLKSPSRVFIEHLDKQSSMSGMEQSYEISLFNRPNAKSYGIDLDQVSSNNLDISTHREGRTTRSKLKPDHTKIEEKSEFPEESANELSQSVKDLDYSTERKKLDLSSALFDDAGNTSEMPNVQTLPKLKVDTVKIKVKSESMAVNKLRADDESAKRRSRTGSVGKVFFPGRKSRFDGPVETERSEASSALKRPETPVKMNFMNLIAMARRMGLVRKQNAYEDYMTKDQFNMIKDFSTGRFDSKEEKRLEQMNRLKMKLLLSAGEHFHPNHKKKERRRTHLIDWKNNLMPNLKHLYAEFKKKGTQVISPNGGTRMAWDVLIMTIIFYDLIMVPLVIVFPITLPDGFTVWDIMEICFFFIDICLNFNTGFYYKGMLVMDRRRIISNYLKGWFYVDLAATFPYEYVISAADGMSSDDNTMQLLRIVRFLKVLRFLRFLRVFKLKRIFIKLESYIDMSTTLISITAFVKLCLIILFIAHFMACAWYAVALIQTDDNQNWLTRRGIDQNPWSDQYIAAFYWAAQTMITVGYGDIVPVTIYEELVAVFAMLVASAVFAYTMNRINIIMAGMETTNEQYQKALNTITEYMRKKHVQKELQIKIKKYLEYALQVETSFDSNETYLNSYLNQSLKRELVTEIHGKVLLENHIISRFDNLVIMKASLIVKEKIFSPEDPVFLLGDNDECSMYIIQTGKVEIFDFRSNSFLKALSRGGHFGEMSFFTGNPRGSSVRSTDFSSLYLIKRQDFLEVLSEYPLEREKFFEIKDKIQIYEDHKVLGLRCYACQSIEHMVSDCPKVHLVIPKNRFIMSYVEKKNEFMKGYIRLGMRGDKAPNRYAKMAEAAQQIQIKVWEGELQMDNQLLYTINDIDKLPGLSEHPSALLLQSKKTRKKIPDFIHNEQFMRIGSSTSSRTENKQNSSIPSMDLTDYENQAQQAPNPMSLKKTNSKKRGLTLMINGAKNNKKMIYDDIDRVCNFTNYFPHNNFSMICPVRGRKQTAQFDYFSQGSSGKEVLKKFVLLLKERVRAKKEAAAKAGGSRPSIFGRLLPMRSRFYKDRGGSHSPKTRADEKYTSPKSASLRPNAGFSSFISADYDKNDAKSDAKSDARSEVSASPDTHLDKRKSLFVITPSYRLNEGMRQNSNDRNGDMSQDSPSQTPTPTPSMTLEKISDDRIFKD